MLTKQLREMERQASVLENNYSQKTNVMNNQESLLSWLEDSFFKTKEQIREYQQYIGGERYKVGNTLYMQEIEKLEFRCKWIKEQCDSIHNNKEQQFPIGFSGKTKF